MIPVVEVVVGPLAVASAVIMMTVGVVVIVMETGMTAMTSGMTGMTDRMKGVKREVGLISWVTVDNSCIIKNKEILYMTVYIRCENKMTKRITIRNVVISHINIFLNFSKIVLCKSANI